MIIDGKHMAAEIVAGLAAKRGDMTHDLSLGIVMSKGDAATESFVRIKSRVAEKLGVTLVREELDETATTEDALNALAVLLEKTHGVIVQLPLPLGISVDTVLAELPAHKDIDAVGKGNQFVLPPVAEAIAEVFRRNNISAQGKQTVVVGAGRLVGKPAKALLEDVGAKVSVVTETQGSLSELKDADIVVLGAGNPGMVTPDLLKEGVVLIDAGTSEQGGKLSGDADPRCAEVASVFTPVPGGIGPIAVAMIFKNLFVLAEKQSLPK